MKLKEVIELYYGKDTNILQDKKLFPVFGTGGIIGYSSNYLYNKESILISRVGTIGVYYVNKPFWTINTLFYTKINSNIVIPKYLYYKLSKLNLRYLKEGSVIPVLTTKIIYNINLDIQSKDVQQHIVNTIIHLFLFLKFL